MKTLLFIITWVICFQLYLAMYRESPTPNIYKPPRRKPYVPSMEDIHKELIANWKKPRRQLRRNITLTLEEYSVWTSLAKFVPPGGSLEETYVNRFCTCEPPPYGKRSLTTRVMRSDRRRRRTGEKRVRMEWRTMTEILKENFIKYFNILAKKNQKGLRMFADFHREIESPGAHGGPAFLPWHRQFLFRLENRLQALGYIGGIPYWNSGLDYPLPKPEESAIFTKSELGVSNGKVDAPFLKNTVSGDCVQGPGGLSTTVERFAGSRGPDSKDALLHQRNLDNVQWNASYATFVNDLEIVHNGPHWWFGANSHMTDLSCVGFDPIFYMHHAYVDYLWEEEYRKHQTTHAKANDYPNGSSVPSAHQKYGTMWPFDKRENIDGMKIQYTNVFYSYQKSPGQCKNDSQCDSTLLWCNDGQCQAKIQNSGTCENGLSPDKQCYCPPGKGTPKCTGGQCRCNL